MFERLRTCFVKEFIQVFRDPRMRAVIFVMPIIQVLIFGYAVTTDVRHVRTAVYDLDNTPASRDLVDALRRARATSTSSGASPTRTEVAGGDRSRQRQGGAAPQPRLRRGPGRRAAPASVQLILDGTDSNTASIVLGYAARIAAAYNHATCWTHRLHGPGARASRWSPSPWSSRAWFNPNLESRNFFVPGVIALLVMVISLILSSMAVVREREIGTMEQIMVTPIGRLEFILGKTIPFALIGFVDVVLVSAHRRLLVPGAPPRQPPALLFGHGPLPAEHAGRGPVHLHREPDPAAGHDDDLLLHSSRPSCSRASSSPSPTCPTVVQWLTYLNPLRYFLVIIRGVFLKGVGFDVLWPQMAALAILGLVLLGLASARFQKTTG